MTKLTYHRLLTSGVLYAGARLYVLSRCYGLGIFPAIICQLVPGRPPFALCLVGRLLPANWSKFYSPAVSRTVRVQDAGTGHVDKRPVAGRPEEIPGFRARSVGLL
jgi:hypothetical protein